MVRPRAAVFLAAVPIWTPCRRLCIPEDAANNIALRGTWSIEPRPTEQWRKSCVA
jgi:hypothetical protein